MKISEKEYRFCQLKQKALRPIKIVDPMHHLNVTDFSRIPLGGCRIRMA